MSFTAYVGFILYLSASRGIAQTCPLGKHPVDPEMFYKSMTSDSGCSRGGITMQHSVRIEPWAVIYTAFNAPQVAWGPPPVCREEIVSVFRRNDKMPQLFHRPAIYGGDLNYDCSKITIRKLMAWGRDRKEFTTLLKRMEEGIKRIRSTHCADDYTGIKPSWTRQELNGRIMRERIATTALSIVNGASYNSYLCI